MKELRVFRWFSKCFSFPALKICVCALMILAKLILAHGAENPDDRPDDKIECGVLSDSLKEASNTFFYASGTSTQSPNFPLSQADASHSVLILDAPKMKLMGIEPSAISFDHSEHEKFAQENCETCHDRIAQTHSDQNLTASEAHAVCRKCHVPRGPASARMGCNDCHRLRPQASSPALTPSDPEKNKPPN